MKRRYSSFGLPKLISKPTSMPVAFEVIDDLCLVFWRHYIYCLRFNEHDAFNE
jgi:hypothetical protein